MFHAITPDEMISAEESLIADVQVVIHNLMEDSHVSRADLARALGVSEARVSQMFSDAAPNLTLRTMARIFRALGEECRVTSDRWEDILASARRNDGAETEISPQMEHARFELEDVFEMPEHWERNWLKEESPSNDNSQVEALAA